MINIEVLTVELVTIAAIVKVIVDMIKMKLPNLEPKYKQLLSIIISIAIAFISGVSVLEVSFAPVGSFAFYGGILAAGIIASLGSNTIHEIMKILQAIKQLNKK